MSWLYKIKRIKLKSKEWNLTGLFRDNKNLSLRCKFGEFHLQILA